MTTQQAVDTYVQEVGGWVASQLEACTRCGMCAEACHFYVATGNPEYTPIWKVELLRRAYEQRFTLSGRLKMLLGLDKRITEADLEHWKLLDYHACTMCNRCAVVCPMGIDIASLVHGARAGLFAAGLVPDGLKAALDRQLEEGSPLGVTDDVFDERLDWVADDWEVEFPVDVQGADSLVVFSSIEIMKFPDNLAAIAKILDAAGEKWTLSKAGREITNFGLYAGDNALTREIMDKVIAAAKELGVKRVIITECGHAYDALCCYAGMLYGERPPFEITHITQVIGEYVRQGRIQLKPGFFENGTITFHDACKIQRRGGFMEQPREVLNIVAPNSFKEMTPNREDAWCCGGGGGVISIPEADTLRLQAFGVKVEQMEAIGATTVTMSCSNCRLQFLDGVKHYDLDIEVTGLAQMVADALVEES